MGEQLHIYYVVVLYIILNIHFTLYKDQDQQARGKAGGGMLLGGVGEGTEMQTNSITMKQSTTDSDNDNDTDTNTDFALQSSIIWI